MRKFIVCIISCILIFTNTVYASDNKQAEVVLSTDPALFSATVPLNLPATILEDGTTATASNAEIQNYSAGAIYVKSINVNTSEGLGIQSYGNGTIGGDEVSFHLNGDSQVQLEGELDLSLNAFPIIRKDSKLPINYSIKIGSEVNTQNLLDITMILDWYTDLSEYRPSAYLDSTGGYLPNPPALVTDSLAIRPTDPTREGYVFEGWYKDKDYSTLWNFDSDVVKYDTVIYAKWSKYVVPEPQPHTVTFDVQGGTVKPPSQSIKYGELVSPVTNQTLSYGGAVFDKWYTDIENNNPWDFSVSTMPDNNITLYAGYVLKEADWDFVVHDDKVILTSYKGSNTKAYVPAKTSDGKHVEIAKATVSSGLFYSKQTVITQVYIHKKATYENNDGIYAFRNCSKLTAINSLPDTVESFNVGFYGCEALVNAPKLPEGLKILNNAFQNCSSLVNPPNIPSSVTEMYSTFYNCTSLTKAANIPEGIENIMNLYNNCPKMVEPPESIPSSVKDIRGAFYGCVKLEGTMRLYCDGTAIGTKYNDVFYNTGKDSSGLTLNWTYPTTYDYIDAFISTKNSGKVYKGVAIN